MKNKVPVISKGDFRIESYLQQQKEVVDRYLDQFLPAADSYPEVIHQAMRYSIFAGGKRIRPVLVLATGEALEGDFQKLIYLACGLEMIHTYSLIHDDLPAMDNDDYRRGHPTAHKKFGEAIAILAGNALMTQAFQLLGSTPSGREFAETKLAVINRLSRSIGTSRGLIGGQVVDLITQSKPFSRKQLEYIHSCKTGALIQAAVSCAALYSEASEEVGRRLNGFGSSIGLAFQIVDDILDVEGSTEELGKTSGKDREKSKATYPAMYGLEPSKRIVAKLVEEAVEEIGFLGPRGEILKEIARYISVRRF